MEVATELTEAEWELGIPPVSKSQRKLNLLCLLTPRTTFKS